METKVLRRSLDNKVLAGVCGGSARYLGLDPTLVRIGWVIMSLLGGGLAAYLIGWFVIPDDSEQRSTLPMILLVLFILVPLACSICWIPFAIMSEAQ